MLEMMKRFVRDEEGVTAIEYGLIASLIAVMIIIGATQIGVKLDEIFQYIATKLNKPAAT
ncbi:Flp family type IVb pilin [Azoarcus sp. PA01]|nr:Flp family type IVb pilin [Azoarcus sp. PA01]